MASTADAAPAPAPQAQREPAPQQGSSGPRPFQLLRVLLPKLPLALRTAVAHVLGFSETAPYLDLRSAVTVAVLRSLCEPNPDPARPRSVSSLQLLSLADAGVRGRLWVGTYASLPPPDADGPDGVRDALARAIDGLGPAPSAAVPPCVAVEAEWTGYRAAAAADEPPPPGASERQKYESMMAEVSHPATVLYFHGGGYYLFDPASHRPTMKRLAKISGGRCYSVRYRLAPGNPFPAALLDALVSYLTLLYPPPDAFHEPVRPEHIVFSGDRCVPPLPAPPPSCSAG